MQTFFFLEVLLNWVEDSFGLSKSGHTSLGRCDALQVTVKVSYAASLAGTVKIQAPSAVSARSPPAPWRFRSTSYPLILINIGMRTPSDRREK